MINVCFFTKRFSLGGAERVNSVIGSYLNNQDSFRTFFYSQMDHVPFYSLDGDFECYSGTFFEKNEYVNKIYRGRRIFEQIRSKGQFTPSKYSMRLIRQFTNFVKDKNISHVIISTPELISLIPHLKEKTPKVKYFSWLHNGWEIYLDPKKNRMFKSFIQGIVESDRVICLTKEDLSKFLPLNDRSVCINNPLTLINEEVSKLDKHVISFASRYEVKQKGLDYLIEIATKIPNDWKITFAGSGNRKETKRLEAMIRDSGVEEKIILKGKLVDKELHEHFLNSSIFIQTSRWEGFSLVLTEAMSFGLPIISFSQTGTREALDCGKYGIEIEQGNVDEFQSKLNQLICDKSLRIEYQRRSLNRVKDFSIESIGEKWISLVRRDVCD